MLLVQEVDFTDDFAIEAPPLDLDENTRAFVEYKLQDEIAAYRDFLVDSQDSDFPVDIGAELDAFWDNAIREYKAQMIPWQEDMSLESRRQEADYYTALADWEDLQQP